MYHKSERRALTFFSAENLHKERSQCMSLVDFNQFQTLSLRLIKQLNNNEAYNQWDLFCTHLKQFSENKSEKLLLMRLAFSCLNNPVETSELSQLITLMRHLKSVYGLEMLHTLLKANIPVKQRSINTYLKICQSLLDLHEEKDILAKVKNTLPNIDQLFEELRSLQTDYLIRKYPERDLSIVLQRFGDKDSLVQFPLDKDELIQIKAEYLAIKEKLPALKTISQAELEAQFKAHAMLWREKKEPEAKYQMLAIIAETIRRQYGIFPYDTQLISILALINSPEKLKGRIAQIKTGEGKSTIIAMLNAFMSSQNHFVDMVTPNSYLGIRDCKKYQPFYKALGLTASHICHRKPKQEHFHAQILYGTNTDFEFAYLRDGLYNRKLRFSKSLDGKLIPRPFDVVIVDEADSLFLDTALNAAQLGITDYANRSWIYRPILQFVKTKPESQKVSDQLINEMREFIKSKLNEQQQMLLEKLSNRYLNRLYQSAHTALFQKKEKQDYIIKPQKSRLPTGDKENVDITIVDYRYTGRTNEGSQWQHGIHQFLQLKHELNVTSPSKTGASISHPAYFNLYNHILGLTGTMGESSEREEIQKIYQVNSFDAPPTFPSQRIRHPDYLLKDRLSKWEAILKELKTIQKNGQPALVLFKTIEESNAFSEFLNKQAVKHQLLNETQKEAEDYVIGQAGEAGVITIATNTAGRGTDILLSPESKEVGGLELIFTFYPDNLRVEDQGLGRAGRQGQPGGARMILSLEDETIIDLLKMNIPVAMKFQLQAFEHFENQDKENKLLPADHLVNQLKELRTSRVQQESAQRYAAAQQEMQYFEKLNAFFTRMNQIYTLVESEDFSKKITDICHSNVYYEQPNDLYDDQNPHWSALIEMANSLLEKQVEGLHVDWTSFLDSFKETYLYHISDLWASYYSKLRDEIEVDNRDEALKAVESLLNAPIEKAGSIVHAILVNGIQRLVQSKNLSM
ncbi:TPA: hypothetical protein JBJ44_03920 [Legionella pneumophila]|nr:hypothetical protein [Legionella pneumophila]